MAAPFLAGGQCLRAWTVQLLQLLVPFSSLLLVATRDETSELCPAWRKGWLCVLESCGIYGSAVLDLSTYSPACCFIPAHLTCLSPARFTVVVSLCLTGLNGLCSLACCLGCDLSWVVLLE